MLRRRVVAQQLRAKKPFWIRDFLFLTHFHQGQERGKNGKKKKRSIGQWPLHRRPWTP
jgi:hypothetical protein